MTSLPTEYTETTLEDVQAARVNTLDYDGLCAILRWFDGTPRSNDEVETGVESGPVMTIETMHGVVEVFDGDWIVRGFGDVFVLTERSAACSHAKVSRGYGVPPYCADCGEDVEAS